MQTYIIQGRQVEFDESEKYLDFSVNYEEGKSDLSEVDWPQILTKLQSGAWVVEEALSCLRYLERWITDAPRKRFYRDLKRQGAGVASREYFFENEPDSDRIINDLHNTGKFARYLLETLGLGAEDYWKQHTPLPF